MHLVASDRCKAITPPTHLHQFRRCCCYCMVAIVAIVAIFAVAIVAIVLLLLLLLLLLLRRLSLSPFAVALYLSSPNLVNQPLCRDERGG